MTLIKTATIYKTSAVHCPSSSRCEWTTSSERAAKFLHGVLREDLDWADAKMSKETNGGPIDG